LSKFIAASTGTKAMGLMAQISNPRIVFAAHESG
jgi:hypothetical protein